MLPVGQQITFRYTANPTESARFYGGVLGLGLSSARVQSGADGLMAEGVAVIVTTDVQALFLLPRSTRPLWGQPSSILRHSLR